MPARSTRASGGVRLCFGDDVFRKPAQLAARQSRPHEHAVCVIFTLVDRRAQGVQLGELAALLVRKQQAHRLEAVRKTLGDALPQRVEAFAGQRRDLQRFGETVCEPPPTQEVGRVDLVDHDLDGKLVRADLVENRVDRAYLLVELFVGRGRIDDVQHEIGDERLLECRRKPFDQLSRQTPDETDGVGHEVATPFVIEAARRRIESLEEPVLDGNLRPRERVQQRRLADVRVAGQRDGRRFGPAAALTPDVALFPKLLQSATEQRDPATGESPVCFELGLAGAARAHAPAETLEVLPEAAHAREVVLELRELDLQLALGARRVLGEDVEDQLRAVDDARLQRVLECPLLRGIELAVDEQHLRTGLLVLALEILELPLAEVGAALRPRPVLDDLADRFDEGGMRKLSQLGQLVVRIDSLGQHGCDEPALQRGIRLACDHDHHYGAMQLSPVLRATGTYPFVKLEEAKRRLAAEGVELIDFGKGDPMEATDPAIRRALVDSLEARMGYPLAEGLPELREAIAGWCGRRFGVELDPGTEIVPTYGSKEAIFLLAQVVVDRDSERRLVLTTEPGYPVPDRGASFAGAEVLQLPLLEENTFLPDLDAVDDDTWERAAIVWINYPNNPTGVIAPLDFLAKIAELSHEHGFLLAADEAYTELWFDEPPHSALEVRARGNVAVFNTLSKRSSMTGYRSGFVAAPPELIAALKQFRPSVGTAPQEFVQRASVVAWNDERHVEQTRAIYARKRDVLLPVLERNGIRVAGSQATMYLWLEVPGGQRSEDFASRLLEHGLIVSPGSFFGAAGEGYWRMALVPAEDECRRAAAILDEVL
jgi:succinyldiaminopimelate transaminase